MEKWSKKMRAVELRKKDWKKRGDMSTENWEINRDIRKRRRLGWKSFYFNSILGIRSQWKLEKVRRHCRSKKLRSRKKEEWKKEETGVGEMLQRLKTCSLIKAINLYKLQEGKKKVGICREGDGDKRNRQRGKVEELKWKELTGMTMTDSRG